MIKNDKFYYNFSELEQQTDERYRQGELEGETQSGVECGDKIRKEMRKLIILTCVLCKCYGVH